VACSGAGFPTGRSVCYSPCPVSRHAVPVKRRSERFGALHDTAPGSRNGPKAVDAMHIAPYINHHVMT